MSKVCSCQHRVRLSAFGIDKEAPSSSRICHFDVFDPDLALRSINSFLLVQRDVCAAIQLVVVVFVDRALTPPSHNLLSKPFFRPSPNCVSPC